MLSSFASALNTATDPDFVFAYDGASDDDRLLASMIADDENAWREFNVRYSRLIYRCITRVTARFSAVRLWLPSRGRLSSSLAI